MGRFGVIVGSGLDKTANPFGENEGTPFTVETPYGDVKFVEFMLRRRGCTIVCTARHLTGHVLLPHEVNYRGIIFAMKMLGVEGVVGISAVGSRMKKIKPGRLVAVTQYIDRTHGRKKTFFGQGIAAHIPFSQPVCADLHDALFNAGRDLGIPVVTPSVLIVMEGPAFSTFAEASEGQGQATLIGMTSMPEAALAREAELCYATLACSTDYDCCFEDHKPVTAEEVGRVFKTIREHATAVVQSAALSFLGRKPCACSCRTALDTAVMTDPAHIDPKRLEELGPIMARWAKKHMPPRT